MAWLSEEALAVLEGHTSTQARWSVLVEGTRYYRPERAALHAGLRDRLLNEADASIDRSALVIAGGPASGKSTLLESAVAPIGVVLNADDLKLRLPEYQQLLELGDARAAHIVHEESSDIARAILEELAGRGVRLTLDAVGDGEPGDFVRKLELLRRHGYSVRVVYADAPTEIAVSRSNERGQRTGRLVPEDVVRSLHREVAARFAEVEALDWLEELTIYSTDGEGPPDRIFSRSGAGTPDVPAPDRVNAFRRKAHE